MLLVLFVNLQRQAVRIKEESHLTPVKVVIAQLGMRNLQTVKFLQHFFDICHSEGQMPQASMLWSWQGWSLRSFFLDKNFQSQISLADIKENILLVRPMVLIQLLKAQLVHIKLPGLSIIMTDDSYMVNSV